MPEEAQNTKETETKSLEPIPMYYEPIRPSKEQLKMKIDGRKRTASQLLGSLHLKLNRKSDNLEVYPLKHTTVYAFTVVSFLFNIFLLVVGGGIKFETLPERIPLFYESVDNSWVQLDKSLIFIFPIFFTILFIIQMRLVRVIFIKDRRLATTILWISSVLNILFLISTIQIYRLIS